MSDFRDEKHHHGRHERDLSSGGGAVEGGYRSVESAGGQLFPGYATPDVTEQTVSPPAAAASPYPSAGGFRAERRFTDPADAPPPEWTADTPPTGFAAPVTTASPPAAQAQPPAAQAQPPAPPHFGGYPNPIPPPVAQAQPPAAQAQPPTAQAQPPAPPHFGGYTNPIPPPVAPGGPLQAPSTPTSRDLSTSALLRQSKPAPSGGWRRWLYLATGRLVNVGESPKHSHRQALLAQVNAPLQGCYRIALLSLKGGVGKTTITATLGATFASIRGDRVIAVDANPDRGTLSQKVPLETPATVRHLLRDAEGISRYSDVRSYTSQGPSRLEVLASESDPAVSEAFSAEDYARTLEILEKFYSLVLTDCGTGLMHSAMSSVLSKADALIVVSSGSVDGARSASATLDWLDAHGYQDLVRRSVAVVNAVRPRSGKVDMQKVVDHFSRRCKAVRLVPFDPHLEEGAEIDLDRLRRETREALIELAAVVADGFPEADRTRQLFA